MDEEGDATRYHFGPGNLLKDMVGRVSVQRFPFKQNYPLRTVVNSLGAYNNPVPSSEESQTHAV